MQVNGFANIGSMEHVHEMANDMRRTSKQLKECQAKALTFNSRERLFSLPLTNVRERRAMKPNDVLMYFIISETTL